ncbi:MAG TPA: ABC transporter permease, partial [Symbiobacteriaceae bacterium]|nr:ABC transporter permease [Symbiobacteriaceae bacterium]
KDPVLLAGTLMVLGLVTVALFADKIAPYPPNKSFMAFQDASGHIWVPGGGPDAFHLLGTDGIGRDILSQLIYGTRFALLMAALVVPARFLLALFLGLAAAWWGGIWDRIVRWLGVFFTAVPQLVVPLVAIALFNRAYANNMPASLAWGVFWVALPAVPRLANAVKQKAITVFSAPFLESAVAAGAGPGRILLRHVLPQMKPQLVTMIALEVPLAMTMMATLSYFRTVPGGWVYDDDFRGVPANPEWGSMMDIPVIIIMSGRWWLWAPFAALFVAVLAFNLLGEGLRRRSTAGTEWRL